MSQKKVKYRHSLFDRLTITQQLLISIDNNQHFYKIQSMFLSVKTFVIIKNYAFFFIAHTPENAVVNNLNCFYATFFKTQKTSLRIQLRLFSILHHRYFFILLTILRITKFVFSVFHNRRNLSEYTPGYFLFFHGNILVLSENFTIQ